MTTNVHVKHRSAQIQQQKQGRVKVFSGYLNQKILQNKKERSNGFRIWKWENIWKHLSLVKILFCVKTIFTGGLQFY